jgi:hypothetical protein
VTTVIIVAAITIYGAVLLGLGVSGFSNEHALAARGVPAVAHVSATSGYGKGTIQVTYQVNGHAVQGTVGADPASVYRGEMLPVVYDPSSPGVVSLANDVNDTSSATSETIVGAVFLLLSPAAFLLSMISRHRHRRRAVRDVLGD